MNKKRLEEAMPRPCEYCGCENVLLRRTIAGSGTVMYFWLCAECQDHARRKNQWVGHDIIQYWIDGGRFKDRAGVVKSPDRIPIHTNYANEQRCEVCDRAGADYHHWAPQSMAKFFGDDWVKWPGAYLCKEHHDLWHEIVTPWMNGRGKSEHAQAVIEWQRELTK